MNPDKQIQIRRTAKAVRQVMEQQRDGVDNRTDELIARKQIRASVRMGISMREIEEMI